MRILITGATGFIGSHLVTRLAAEHEIFALIRRTPPTPLANVHYIVQDLREPLDRNQLPDELDAIIHQAALIDTDTVADSGAASAENSGATQDALPFLVNVVATWRLLEYAAEANVQSFIHASTGGIYGCRDHQFDEGDRPNPMDLYSLTKAQAELAVRSAPGTFHKIILRYFFPYGKGTPNPIPSYIRRAVLGEPIDILAGGGPRFNPLHIADAIEATVRALELADSTTLNIAGTEVTTFAEIARLAAAAVGREPHFNIIPDETAIPYYRADLIASTIEMSAVLGFVPKWSLQDGIAELAASYYNSP